MHQITLFRLKRHQQGCLQANVENQNQRNHVIVKTFNSRALEIEIFRTFDMEIPTNFNKSFTQIAFRSAAKHRQRQSYNLFHSGKDELLFLVIKIYLLKFLFRLIPHKLN